MARLSVDISPNGPACVNAVGELIGHETFIVREDGQGQFFAYQLRGDSLAQVWSGAGWNVCALQPIPSGTAVLCSHTESVGLVSRGGAASRTIEVKTKLTGMHAYADGRLYLLAEDGTLIAVEVDRSPPLRS